MKDSTGSPITGWSRIYGVLAGGAVLLVAICFYAHADYLNWSGAVLEWFGLLLLAGAILYGFKIARQASTDARKNTQLLQETKQRTMEIAALYDTLQHVSEKHELRALLQIILERAKTLLSAAGCAIFLFDKEQNDFEIAVEAGVGMPIGTHLPQNQGLAGRVVETRKPVIVNDYPNWPYRSKALQQLPIRAAVCVPMIRGGELVGVLGVHEIGGNARKFTDADARLLSLFADNAAGAVHTARLLDALQSSEERFRMAAQCATDIVYDWDLLKNRVDYFGALFEKSRAENTRLAATREEYWSLIHPDDRERVEKALESHFATGRPFSEEYRLAGGRGTYINVADRATAILSRKGIPVRLIGGLSDITEQKHAEQMKSDFVSFVTHQLRTPLSGVKWMLELATDSLDEPDEARSYIQDARMSTERLIGMVNDLLHISRLERGKLQLTFHNLDVVQITQSIVDEVSPLAVEKGQSLTLEITPGVPAVRGDEQLLRQAILNLVSNAIKYTPADGKIHIHIKRDGEQVLWSVEDTGIGIPKADLSKLFDKFYRAGNVLAVETEGTGLGLYLVRLIMDRFGGKVWCESAENSGSNFLLALPIAVSRGANE
jgi:signal transduction histidine kinase/putative methionine-R-sulfoxide reductase with GAF domain